MSEKIMSVDNEFFKGVDFGDMDKLDVIFAMQEKFDQDVIKNRGLQDVTPEQWIQKQTLAMLSELAELIAEVNFKWWKNPKPVDIGNVREEVQPRRHGQRGAFCALHKEERGKLQTAIRHLGKARVFSF